MGARSLYDGICIMFIGPYEDTARFICIARVLEGKIWHAFLENIIAFRLGLRTSSHGLDALVMITNRIRLRCQEIQPEKRVLDAEKGLYFLIFS